MRVLLRSTNMKSLEGMGLPDEYRRAEETVTRLEETNPEIAESLKRIRAKMDDDKQKKAAVEPVIGTVTNTNTAPVNTSDKSKPKPRRQFTTFLEQSLPPGDRD